MKRTLAILLSLVLLIGALPGIASAETEGLTKEQAVIKEARRVYYYSLSSAQKTSFAGFCGLMTSHQLWHMGINDWLEVYDGNRQFDAYAAKEQTTGGYYITDYPATDYTLEQALNAITRNGTQDAYNILVGFQWTNTPAGGRYGHACVINAILDGKVYFVESFYTSLGGPEGNVVVCTIPEFAKLFGDWTVFEGAIHFGNKEYADSCQFYGTDVFVRTRFDSNLRSQPSLLSENECTRLRSLSAGEMLRATAVVKNPRGELYYRIDEDGQVGYVIANAVSVIRLNGEDLSLADATIPTVSKPGEAFTIGGTVTAANSNVSEIEVTITDAVGTVVLQLAMENNGNTCDIGTLNKELSFNTLETGAYTLTLCAKAACVVAKGTGLVTQHVKQTLLEQQLHVGDTEGTQEVLAQEQEAEMPDGWQWKNGTWYFYKNGRACTGWIRDLGVDYYLNEDGSVTTGWTDIDGWRYYFSPTGAMCIGWLTTPDGTVYRTDDGLEALGWQEIEGKRYYFDEYGFLVTKGTVMDGQQEYEIKPDGQAIKATEKTE